MKNLSIKIKLTIGFIILTLVNISLNAENGHDLWVRGKSIAQINVICSEKSPTLQIAKQELQQCWQGESNATISLVIKNDKAIKGDGFRISSNQIQANTEWGILYGVYELLRRQQSGKPICEEVCNPSYERRLLNHWDNLDGT
ncbi:MAG: alpha-glucuronidase, partial [Bacteroidales bacterium]|nr:alpha-glucuronidase [Bacteroidales bacterium]